MFYYIFPRKYRWIELLILSLVFYYFAGTWYTVGYLIISTLSAYVATNSFKHKSKNARIALVLSLSLNIIIWFVIKGRGLWQFLVDGSKGIISNSRLEALFNVQLVAALGMGYYTLQIIGYIIDCYWGNMQPQRNPLKLFLFVSFFPQLTTGPISRYTDFESVYLGNSFKYRNIAFGAQRILWGLVKKIVLAERVGVIVSAITLNESVFTGYYSWIAILLYPIQMYADFSGCMDIVLGTSEIFGIKLAENFNNPFFARSSQEFWQRWHITLGTWAKDYVLYPLLKSNLMIILGKKFRLFFGRKHGKFLITAIGMFVLWMIMGIWHGGLRYIVGVSMWYWIILMGGELLSPALKKINKILSIKTESFSWHCFQSVRTYFIYSIGAVFFNVGVHQGFRLLNDAFQVLSKHGKANPWIFFDGSILSLGIQYSDLNIILVAVILLIIVGVLREKYGYARNWVEKQGFAFRWMIWIGLLLFLIIWGKYGPEYNATDFIYKGF